jgi:glyoxylase I family protein
MIQYKKLNHVSFAAKDLVASRAFFEGVLGFQQISRPDFDFAGIWYALADRALHIIENREAETGALPRLSRADHVALEVESVDAVRETLRQHGVEFQEGMNERLGMTQVFCRDPDGHAIEFIEFLRK